MIIDLQELTTMSQTLSPAPKTKKIGKTWEEESLVKLVQINCIPRNFRGLNLIGWLTNNDFWNVNVLRLSRKYQSSICTYTCQRVNMSNLKWNSEEIEAVITAAYKPTGAPYSEVRTASRERVCRERVCEPRESLWVARMCLCLFWRGQLKVALLWMLASCVRLCVQQSGTSAEGSRTETSLWCSWTQRPLSAVADKESYSERLCVRQTLLQSLLMRHTVLRNGELSTLLPGILHHLWC